jgi:hypothetical protein
VDKLQITLNKKRVSEIEAEEELSSKKLEEALSNIRHCVCEGLPLFPLKPAKRAGGTPSPLSQSDKIKDTLGGDIHFEPYPFPLFRHPLMHSTYGPRVLNDIPLWELEAILEKVPDPQLKDFIACRVCYLHRFMVYRTYEKALSIDVSKLDGEGLLQYQKVMDECRRVQNVLDTIADPERMKDVLHSPQFASAFRMKLPGPPLANLR